MTVLDMRIASFATIGKKVEPKIMTKEIKNAIKANDYTVKFADYGTVRLKDYTKTTYRNRETKDIIELDVTKIIDDYCKTHNIEIVKEKIKDYSVEIVPSEKAVKEYNIMLEQQEQSIKKNIAKIAEQLKEVVQNS